MLGFGDEALYRSLRSAWKYRLVAEARLSTGAACAGDASRMV
jgi:hypothetical protein